ncbi:MAG: APC family permease [Conexivisphaerales archaeon]
MTDQKVNVFVRESTGLVKNVSMLDAISLNISSMSGGAALATIAFTMLLVPAALGSVTGLNLVFGSLVAFGITIPQIIVYTMMTRRLPRTGGDYVWTSRAFGGFVGSTVSFMGYTLETMAFLALIVIATVLAIGSVGVSLGNQVFLSLALPGNVSGSNAIAQFVLGSVLFAALIALNIFKPKLGYKLVSLTVVIGIASLVTANFVLLLAGRAGVVAFINSLAIPDASYQSIAASYTGSSFNFSSTLFMMPFFAMFCYPWFVAAPAVASEIKGRKAIFWNVPISALVSVVIVTASFAVLYYVAGFAFTTAALTNPILVNDYSFNFWTLAMGVSGNQLLAGFIGFGWILWNIGILAYGIIGISRYIFAQAFDRFLPEKLSYISPRFGSPVIAHLLDLLVTVILVGLASFFYGTLTSLYGAIMASMIYFIFVGLSAVNWARKHERGAIKSLLSVSGLLSAGVFVFLTYEFLAFGSVWGGNLLAYGYIAASVILGAILYLYSKSKHAKKGIDISLVFKEIPPE